jgi:hypothetical protein
MSPSSAKTVLQTKPFVFSGGEVWIGDICRNIYMDYIYDITRDHSLRYETNIYLFWNRVIKPSILLLTRAYSKSLRRGITNMIEMTVCINDIISRPTDLLYNECTHWDRLKDWNQNFWHRTPADGQFLEILSEASNIWSCVCHCPTLWNIFWRQTSQKSHKC